jgi:hypothetical protein
MSPSLLIVSCKFKIFPCLQQKKKNGKFLKVMSIYVSNIL